MIKRWTGLSLILACLILTACGGSGGGSHPGNNGGTPPTNPDDGGDDNGPPPGTINVSPKADAGRDQNVKVGDTVTLDGTKSRDEDGDPLTYRWELESRPDGSAAELQGADTVKPTFVPDLDGEYVISLSVNDGKADSKTDRVTITADHDNSAPVADAGPDQSVKTGATVTLDGSASSDADGDLLSHQWSFVTRPKGSMAELEAGDTAKPRFVPDVDGVYEIALVVNDGLVDSASATITVTAATPNSAPVSHAGNDQNVTEGATVTLNGSGSSDADGDPLSYQWQFVSRPAGSTATLASADTVAPTFVADVAGTFVIELIVNDGQIDSEPTSVSVTAEQANVPPVADAGRDQNVIAGTTVSLDGSASSDADGDSLTYQWTFVAKPDGSAAALSDATKVTPTFIADLAGTYVLELVVNDGETDSAGDRITITAERENTLPVADAGPDQNVTEGATVTLNGSASSDADGDPLSYQWQFVSRPDGSTAALDQPNSAKPQFDADVEGQYVVRLVVTDEAGGVSDADTVMITVSKANSIPVADAGANQSVLVDDIVVLDGRNSRDADDDPLSYQWGFVSKPAGSTATLSDTQVVSPTFVADVEGNYVLSLVVNDGEADSASDNVTITAERLNTAPVADAGPDQNVYTGTLVTLDGSGSHDADGDSLTYQWRLVSSPAGSAAALVDATTSAPSFTPDFDGTYVAELKVSDGEQESPASQVTITATTANSVPVANAGPDQSVYVGSTVTLDGSGSSDADGDPLNYTWTLQSGPAGSSAELVDAGTVAPSFTPDVAGDYVVNLTVSDGESSSNTDSVKIQAAAPKLQMEVKGSTGWRSTGLPYITSGSASYSCVGSCGDRYTLSTFRLTAVGRNYTLKNVQAIVISGAGASLNPRITGLSSDQVIADGTTVGFTLDVSYVRVSNVTVRFSFEVDETGDRFTATETITLR
ncbi:hypothetical protein Q668_16945 [Alcanivorax sp. PN-3]|nr:hypothetical protein Q668_16945 [Alcanivorax sp. PN-3]